MVEPSKAAIKIEDQLPVWLTQEEHRCYFVTQKHIKFNLAYGEWRKGEDVAVLRNSQNSLGVLITYYFRK
jgi:hypothetical protein